jgi:hypothetical protein
MVKDVSLTCIEKLPFVLFAHIILFRKIYKVCDRLCCQQLKAVHDVDLGTCNQSSSRWLMDERGIIRINVISTAGRYSRLDELGYSSFELFIVIGITAGCVRDIYLTGN